MPKENLGPLVSVVVCVKNGEACVGGCIESVLNQDFSDFELIIIDDASIDETKLIIEGFKDDRIKYFRNPQWLGISRSRNAGLANSKGKFVFFTDADCVVSQDWLSEGLKYLESGFLGVEGKIYYVSENYQPTFSDHVMKNIAGGNYMTGNIAYNNSIVKAIGGFNEKLSYHSDREIALRVMKVGKIFFNPGMVVFHPRVTITPKMYLKSASLTKNRIHLFKNFKDRQCFLGPIIYPGNLLKILFPPLVFVSLFFNKFKSSEDFKLIPYSYVHSIIERLLLWKEGVVERVFIL